MSSTTDIPGTYLQVFTIDTNNLFDFEPVRSALMSLEGVEEVLYDDQLSPAEVTLLTDGTIADTTVQRLAAQQGHHMQSKHSQLS